MGHISVMNDGLLDEFRALIDARLLELQEAAALGKDAQAVVELDQQAVGRLSRMDALQNQSMAKAQEARRNAENRRLALARQRLDDGEFGYCEDCGEDIPEGRLRLDLTAARCVSCASG